MGRWSIRRRLRRMTPGLLSSMSLLSWLGQMMMALPVVPEDDTPVGPPPGHPERHAGDQPMTPEERALWANLKW